MTTIIVAPTGFPVGSHAVVPVASGWRVLRLMRASNLALNIEARWLVIGTYAARETAERVAQQHEEEQQ